MTNTPKPFTDAEFTEELRSYLEGLNGSEVRAVVPVFYEMSGRVNREKTLNLPAFSGMTEQKKAELLK